MHHLALNRLPENVAAFGSHKVRPTLRKAPDRVMIWTNKLNGVGPRAIKFAEPQSGYDVGVRQQRRWLQRAQKKGVVQRDRRGTRSYA